MPVTPPADSGFDLVDAVWGCRWRRPPMPCRRRTTIIATTRDRESEGAIMKPLIAIVAGPTWASPCCLINWWASRYAHRGGYPASPATGCTPRRMETGSSTWWTPAASSPPADSQILALMRQQAAIAIQHATVESSLSATSRPASPPPTKRSPASMLRSQKPVVLAVNKMDQVGITNPDIISSITCDWGSHPCPPSAMAPGICWMPV